MMVRFGWHFFLLFVFLLRCTVGFSQSDSINNPSSINPWNFSDPKEYVIAGASLEGSNLNKGVLLNLAEIPVGSSITLPGDDLAMAIKRLWDQRIFAGVSIYIDSVQGNQVFLRLSIT